MHSLSLIHIWIEELYRESNLLLLENAGEELDKKKAQEQEAGQRIGELSEEIKTVEEELARIRIHDAKQSSKEEWLTSRQEECQEYFLSLIHICARIPGYPDLPGPPGDF